MRARLPLVVAGLLHACSRPDAPSTSSIAPNVDVAPARGDSAPDGSGGGGGVRNRSQLAPRVTLDGQSAVAALTAPTDSRPRIYARTLRLWIFERPSRTAGKLGYLRVGGSTPLVASPVGQPARSAAAANGIVGRDDCPDGWYRVEPEGYVCASHGATLDANDPLVRAASPFPPDPTRKLPYIYGTVRRPGPVYARLPSKEELKRAEPDVDGHVERWLGANGDLGASYAQDVWLGGKGELVDAAKAWNDKLSAGIPDVLDSGASLPPLGKRREASVLVVEQMRPRVGYSFLQTFFHQGRRYGLTTDLVLVPTDRLRPIRGSDFHGFEIGKEIDFPFAIVRQPTARLYVWQKSSKKLIDAGTATYRAPVKLTGRQQFFAGRLHYETADGKWLSDLDASRIDPARRMPGWGKNGEKWIDVNVTKQTLVLYEGTKPVYATLMSSGEAGLEDPTRSTATKRGIFRIHTKHLTTTMSSDEVGEEFELRDVPYVQYFDEGGYAMHGAYWHDRFGVPKSHGCINLAPEDARRIFFWTEPTVPTGWHAVLLPLRGTVLFVHP